MTETPNEIGASLEDRVAEVMQGRKVRQSGGGRFVKLDDTDRGGFIYSCKATRKIRQTALRAIDKLWREAVTGTRGFAGHGNDAKPAMAFELESGEVLVLVRLEDHAALATGEIQSYVEPTKGAGRRARASAHPRSI